MRAKHWMPDRLIRSTATFGRKRHWTHATEPAVPPLTLGISNPETAEPLIIWPTSPLAAPRPSGCGIPAACAWTATTTRRPGERSSRSGCATNVPRRCQSRSGCGCFRPSSTSTPAALTCSCRSATCWSKTSRARRGGTPAEPAVPQPVGVCDRADLLGGLVGERLAAPVGSVDHLAAGRRNTPHPGPVGGERAVVHGQSRRGYVADWRRSSRDMEAGFRVRRLSRPSCPSTCTRPPTRGWLMLRPKRKRCAASSS